MGENPSLGVTILSEAQSKYKRNIMKPNTDILDFKPSQNGPSEELKLSLMKKGLYCFLDETKNTSTATSNSVV